MHNKPDKVLLDIQNLKNVFIFEMQNFFLGLEQNILKIILSFARLRQ
jgi:hypothetical protein